MYLPLLFSLIFLSSFVSSESDDHAYLLVSKNVLNQYLVEKKDLTIQYVVYNIGTVAARNVQLKDEGFPTEDFEVVHGSLNVNWPRIHPESNVTHSVVVKALKSGYYNFTSAEVTYLATQNQIDPQVSFSSAPGQGGIINSKDYDRKFSPHVVDWIAFAVMTLPSLGIPYLLWFSSKSKYDKAKKS